MDVNSHTFAAVSSPQVIATTALVRRAAYATAVNLGPNFCARRFSVRPSTARQNPVYPNHQVNSVRTKATRTDPAIFAIFVRTPVFSRTIFVRTQRQLRAHSHHLHAHNDLCSQAWQDAQRAQNTCQKRKLRQSFPCQKAQGYALRSPLTLRKDRFADPR